MIVVRHPRLQQVYPGKIHSPSFRGKIVIQLQPVSTSGLPSVWLLSVYLHPNLKYHWLFFLLSNMITSHQHTLSLYFLTSLSLFCSATPEGVVMLQWSEPQASAEHPVTRFSPLSLCHCIPPPFTAPHRKVHFSFIMRGSGEQYSYVAR